MRESHVSVVPVLSSIPLHLDHFTSCFGRQQTWHFTVLLCLPHVTTQLTAA